MRLAHIADDAGTGGEVDEEVKRRGEGFEEGLQVHDAVDSRLDDGHVVVVGHSFEEDVLRSKSVIESRGVWKKAEIDRETYAQDQRTVDDTANRRHLAEDLPELFCNVWLAGNVAAADFDRDAAFPQLLHSCLGGIACCATPGYENKMSSTFAWEPAGEIETDTAGSSDDDVRGVWLDKGAGLPSWMNLLYC